MFQQMINGSIAVLSRPSVATFEEHERNSLQWALIYSIIAGVINAIFTGIGAAIRGPATIDTTGLSPEQAEIAQQFAQTSGPGIGGLIFGALILTPIVLLIAWGITYGLGRAFGGTGQFGELAYDLALFGAPLTVINSVLGIIPFLGGIAALALLIYNFYLTYLAIQSGMNLPSNKALYVILVQLAIGIAIGACICAFVGTAALALFGLSGTGQ